VKLREWEADPAGWRPHGKTPTAPVYLTAELVAAYVEWCCELPDGKARRRNTDGATVANRAQPRVSSLEGCVSQLRRAMIPNAMVAKGRGRASTLMNTAPFRHRLPRST
jgi:hypothetical protein